MPSSTTFDTRTRDLEFDDALWREAIAAFRFDEPIERLRDRAGAYASIVEELVDEAGQGPILVGLRLGSPGKNPRLLALLTAAFFARAGHETLLVDLGADVRWLEATLGRDFKEGIVDHLQYGVPLERCMRRTGLERLTALSGGARFLTGSPLDDAPGIRATLERLRREHRVVVVAMPPPVETADEAGMPALCDALVTIVEEGIEAPLAGSERATIRLTGDPRAAGDLARWTRRFVGDLPALLVARADVGDSSRPEASGGGEDPVAAHRPGSGASDSAPDGTREPVHTVTHEVNRAAGLSRAAERRSEGPTRSRRVPLVPIVAGVAVVVAGIVGWFLVVDGEDRSRVAVEPVEPPIELALGGEAGVPTPEPDALGADRAPTTPPEEEPEDGIAPAGEVSAVAGVPEGRPAPWSAHVGSYLSAESGARLVDRITEAGELAFLVPVDLPGKGRWHRVYVGAYGDSASAERALERLVEADVVEEGLVRSTPLAFRLGIFEDRRNAERIRDTMRSRGVSAYVTGDDPVRVWAGAYASRAEAEPMARALAGTETEWTLRRR